MITLDTLREHAGTIGMAFYALWLFVLVMMDMTAGPAKPSAITTTPTGKTERVRTQGTGDEETESTGATELGCLMIEGIEICDGVE